MSDIEPALERFLELLEKDIKAGNLVHELPGPLGEFMSTRNLSNVDVDEVIENDDIILGNSFE